MAIDWKNKLGSLWSGSNNYGPFMTGTINGVKVFVAGNKKRPGKKDPDFNIFTYEAEEDQRPPEEPNGNVKEEQDEIPF